MRAKVRTKALLTGLPPPCADVWATLPEMAEGCSVASKWAAMLVSANS